MKNITIKRMAFVGVFAAISTILYYFVKFPLPIFPEFLEINFSMVPIIIAVFMLGPIDGAIIVVIRFILKIFSSKTAGVGEIADLILGLATSLPCGFFYKYYKGKHNVLLAFTITIISWVISSILINAFINIPAYIKLFFGGNWDTLIGICKTAFNVITFGNSPDITKENFILYYILLAVIPFNLMLSSLVVGVTALVHKRLRVIYDRIN